MDVNPTMAEIKPADSGAWVLDVLNRIALGQKVDPTERDLARQYYGLDRGPRPGYGDVTRQAPEPIPARQPEPTLTLAEWVAAQYEHYRGLGTDAGLLIADAIGDVLAELEVTKARTVDQLWDRRAVLAGHHD